MKTAHLRGVSRVFVNSLCLVLISSFLLAGCASRGGETYSDSEVRSVQSVEYGVVTDVRVVQIEEDPSMLGPAIGGVAGGVLGSLIGHGAGRTLATLGGAAVGALAGAGVESQVRKYSADEITVDTEGGKTVVIVQSQDDYFAAGDRVRIVYSGQNARVQHR